MVNWSNGMSALSASITQSRYGQIDRGAVLLVAVGVGVAGQVEPVPRPALAVVRRREQPVDQPSRRRPATSSFDERVDLLRRRRQADQVERRRGGSACTGRPRGDGFSPSFSSRARTKRSIGLRGPALGLHVRQRRPLRRRRTPSAARTSAPAATQRLSVVLLRGRQRLLRRPAAASPRRRRRRGCGATSSLSSGLPGRSRRLAPARRGRRAAASPCGPCRRGRGT